MTKTTEQPSLDLSAFLAVLLKRGHYIILIGLLFGALSYLFARSIPARYDANATLLIEAQANKAVSIKDVYDFDTNKKEYYLTQFELLKSRTLAEKVIDELNLKDSPAFLAPRYPRALIAVIEKARELKNAALSIAGLKTNYGTATETELAPNRQDLVKLLQSNLTVTPIRKTQLVIISYQASTPQLAAKVVNALGQAYIESNLDVQTEVNQQAYFWLSDKVAELNKAVKLSEAKLADFLESEKLVDSSGIDSLVNTELTRLTEQLSEVRNRRIAAESIDQVLKSNKNVSVEQLSTISAISNHPQVRDIRVSQLETEKYVSELSKRYGPKHDKMIQAKAQLEALNQKSQQIVSSLAQGVENELNSTKQQEQTLIKELEDKKSEFQNFTKKRARYQALNEELASNRKLYNLFLTRQKETSATQGLTTAVARFVDYAIAPKLPSGPNKKKWVAAFSFLGMLLATISFFTRDLFYSHFRHSGDIQQHLQINPIGLVPKTSPKNLQINNWQASISGFNQQAMYNEAIKDLRTALILAPESQHKSLMITSSLAGEGKTSLSISLALSTSKLKKVLLIDADLRNPGIGKAFGLKASQPGLSNLMVMDIKLDELIIKHTESGLSLIPAGLMTRNPQEFLASPRFGQLLEKLERQFDHIIIDSAPISPVSDSLIIGQHVNSALFVIKANSTPVMKVHQSLSRLTQHKIPVTGVVLNQLHKKQRQYEIGHGYGYDYQTGQI